MAITVVIADDQEMVRTGFRMILESQPDIEVLADVVDGEAALDAVERHDPDVLLLDIRMPRLDGLEATRRLTARGSRPRIVIVTTFDLDEYVHAALHGGACGFLLKNASPAMLVEAVRAAAVGDALVSPAVTVRLLRELAPRTTAPGPAEPLTQRERDVVRALARGRTNAEIAAELYVSLSTVKSHLANVQAKLAARNRVEIAAWAWESGLATKAP
ncbi:response regulator [Streptomyces spectabilis]|uniref:DNA-binding NarL/FixJ family response regulator n=1 Tax=Streptomyces spectabilis TaxID=68270 RepID=A0A5P2X6N4_STRST|nr:response regulator transcription factor [Streptomyces spectabilis]MBB5102730.1 DNA-binding NarL/FixJ family response regulator [Streptomyces spectabilis]MCI3901933.1 response regulator transcription factor [Streptomyces spectabilis]QEV59344.1 DNA-binding response regulator [Streptomyces spectabilis]GGV17077.1 DNA-binding response regulator [Streptomyces spectabilis]